MENIFRMLRGNLSQAAFAKKVGLSQKAICNYENGRFPKPEILNKIAEAAGYKINLTIEKIDEGEK